MPDTATADRWYVVDTFHAGVQVPNTLPSPHDSNTNKWSKRWTDDEVDDIVSGDMQNRSFRILGAGARVRRPRSCCFQNSVTQQLEPGAATHGPLDRLQATDLSLDRPRAPRQ